VQLPHLGQRTLRAGDILSFGGPANVRPHAVAQGRWSLPNAPLARTSCASRALCV